MSGLSMYSNENNIIFATDTLATSSYGYPFTPVNHQSKVNFYPHLKCCIVALGSSKLGDDMYSFIQLMKACDTLHLRMNIEKSFHKFLKIEDYEIDPGNDEKRDPNKLGFIYIFGVSDLEKKIIGYEVTVKRDGVTLREMAMINSLLVHPPIKNVDKDRIWNKFESAEPSVANLADIMAEHIIQMQRDSMNESTFQVAVGMEIHLIHISYLNGEFSCHFLNPRRFEDFTETYLGIVERM